MYEPDSILRTIESSPKKYSPWKIRSTSSLNIPRPVSLSFTDTQEKKECPKTPPRYTYNRQFQTPSRKSTTKIRNKKLPSPSPSRNGKESTTDVRFIPKRSNMRFDLCRASILSAEKRARKNENVPNTNTPKREVLSPLQTEFRRRMRGALLDVPLHDSISSSTSDVTMNDSFTSNTNNNTSFIDSLFANDTSFSSDAPAYRALPEGNPSDAEDNLGPGPLGRMLNFEKENDKKQQVDPYIHDQLHVLDRTNKKYLPSPSDSSSTIYRNLTKKITTRKIPTQPSRILDAPELVDDYYLNLVSWGSCNVLAVALGQCVYLWHAKSGDIDHLLTLEEEEDYVTSVTWCGNGGSERFLAVGTNKSVVQIWDTGALKKVRTLRGHSARVGSLSWTHNCLTSGSRDSLILQHDLRTRSITNTYTGHLQEVCGLKWNDDGTTLASGGNENYLCIWDAAMSSRRSSTTSPRLILTQHVAAVKALAWCPFHKGLLASGGGTADRTIKFWNSNSGALLNSIDTGSQVCSLLWSKYQKEICSSHGFSENQLILWRYPTMTKIQEFTGHTARVLHMEQSPDGSCVVSAAADETLRFWDIFGAPPSDKRKGSKNLFQGSPCSLSSYGMATIR